MHFALNKPILGERNFTRESGSGVDLVVKQPLAMFGTHPAALWTVIFGFVVVLIFFLSR